MPTFNFSSLLFLVPTVNIDTFYDWMFILFLDLFLLFTIFRDTHFFKWFFGPFFRFVNKFWRF